MVSQDQSKELEEPTVWSWTAPSHRDHSYQVHSDKRTVTFHSGGSEFAKAVRGTKTLGRNMEHYFEVELKPPFFGQTRQVGVGTKDACMQGDHHDFAPLLGKAETSWGINYSGNKYHHGVEEKYVSIDPDQCESIIVGVLYDSYYGVLSFKLNGRSTGAAYDIPPSTEVYPMLCSSSARSVMRLVYSSSSLMPLKALCRGVIRRSISCEDGYHELGLPSRVRAYVQYNISERA